MRILVAVLLVAAAQPDSSRCSETSRQQAVTGAGRVVRSCIRAQAPALARSGDRADDVATAVMVRCEASFDGVLSAIAACSPSSAARLRARLGREFHAIAVEEVVSLRSRR
jgi:hypothetical protein